MKMFHDQRARIIFVLMQQDPQGTHDNKIKPPSAEENFNIFNTKLVKDLRGITLFDQNTNVH